MAKSIVRASIHPAIGVARVGSSQDDYLLAPQVPFPRPRAAGTSHDATGQLKREAVEFRVYGYDEDGAVVAELNADNAKVTWTVHVANAKAGWYKFRHAMDVPSLSDTVVERRNPAIVDVAERRALVIDPGPRSISGRNQHGSPYQFDTGKFKDLPVTLGELRSDASGRLLFLSGFGVSRSPSDAPPYVDGINDPFGNADDWHDDIADGPVDATVVFEGRLIPTEGAWVASAPPNYAPDLKSWRTLYDALVDAYVAWGWMQPKPRTSFVEDVHPALARLSALQWVNKASASVFGHRGPFDFGDPELIDRLSRIHGASEDVYKPLRMSIFRAFRDQEPYPSDPAAWPWLYGDAFGSTENAGTEPYMHLVLNKDGQRFKHLKNWVEGNFDPDWGRVTPPDTLDGYSLQDQPAALDRAALDFCAADAFHPGIELTWPMRQSSLYTKPFRIKRAAEAEPDYGTHLTVQRALGADGPLHGQFPGSLTRWMLLPWQIDTGGCLAGYESGVTVFDAPSFWPARVPNFVLPHSNYRRANDKALTPAERLLAFQVRRSWFHPLGIPAREWGERLIQDFGRMGVVEAYPRTTDDPELPAVMYAETLPPGLLTSASAAGAAVAGAALTATSAVDREAQSAGFADEAERQAMRTMRFGR